MNTENLADDVADMLARRHDSAPIVPDLGRVMRDAAAAGLRSEPVDASPLVAGPEVVAGPRRTAFLGAVAAALMAAVGVGVVAAGAGPEETPNQATTDDVSVPAPPSTEAAPLELPEPISPDHCASGGAACDDGAPGTPIEDVGPRSYPDPTIPDETFVIEIDPDDTVCSGFDACASTTSVATTQLLDLPDDLDPGNLPCAIAPWHRGGTCDGSTDICDYPMDPQFEHYVNRGVCEPIVVISTTTTHQPADG
ncbi:MAG: hypothetical protein AAGD35_00870 [Actinomycetota bacterium]